jgi:23S rRNA pseudouridine2604 synthase
MSERRKITLPAGKTAESSADPRRKPLRPNAPVQRNRVRPPEGSEPAPAAAAPAASQAQERAPRPAPSQPRQRPPAEPQRNRGDRGDRGDRNDRGDRERPQDRGHARGPDRAPPPAPRANAPLQPHSRAVDTSRQAPEDGRVRLSKLMSEQGLSSRREADEWIGQGWVSVDGEVVIELGTRVWPNQQISIDPMAHAQQAQRVTILLNKPIGYVSGQAEDGYEPAVVLIRPENRWEGDTAPWQLTRGHLNKLAPAGRLDIDSTGILVLTQDGRIARHLIGEDAMVEKEYLVRVELMRQPEVENVSAAVPQEDLERLRFGLWLDDKPLKPAKVSWQNEQQLRFVLREGKKRQIRRMCEQVGLKVVGLKRVRMGQVVLGKLPLGQWRFLRPDERF